MRSLVACLCLVHAASFSPAADAPTHARHPASAVAEAPRSSRRDFAVGRLDLVLFPAAAPRRRSGRHEGGSGVQELLVEVPLFLHEGQGGKQRPHDMPEGRVQAQVRDQPSAAHARCAEQVRARRSGAWTCGHVARLGPYSSARRTRARATNHGAAHKRGGPRTGPSPHPDRGARRPASPAYAKSQTAARGRRRA